MNSVNTKTHSAKDMVQISSKMQMLKAFVVAKQRTKSKLLLFSECVETKLCKPCTSFTSHLHSSCGMMWYSTLRVKLVDVYPLSASSSSSYARRRSLSPSQKLLSFSAPPVYHKACPSVVLVLVTNPSSKHHVVGSAAVGVLQS